MSLETCNICKWFDGSSDHLIVSKGKYFTLFFPKVPMVYREDGGHLILMPNRHVVDLRFFSKEECLEYMVYNMVSSKVFYELLPSFGIQVGRVNYHDNGNVEADKQIGAHQHLHFYGRAKNSSHQTWKESLIFPSWNPEDEYYKNATHFTTAEKQLITTFVKEKLPKIKAILL